MFIGSMLTLLLKVVSMRYFSRSRWQFVLQSGWPYFSLELALVIHYLNRLVVRQFGCLVEFLH